MNQAHVTLAAHRIRPPEAEGMYVRDESADSSGAHLMAAVDVAPRFLIERFGAPVRSDGIQISGCYTFRSRHGVVFTVHDYKSTTLWASGEGLPTPEAFWELRQPMELWIDARGEGVPEFTDWLLAQYDAWRAKSRARSRRR